MSWASLANRDIVAAAALILFGAFVLYVGRDYDMGTVTNMGPGYFPSLLAVIVIFFGLIVLVKAIAAAPIHMDDWHVRPIAAVTAATLLFAVIVDRSGLIMAAVALTALSRLAARPYRPTEVAIVGGALAIMSVAIFIHLLALPLQAW